METKIKKGDCIYYHPIIGRDPRYIGYLETDPFQLGSGHWCAHLDMMEPDYLEKYGKSRVVAASLDALEVCEIY